MDPIEAELAETIRRSKCDDSPRHEHRAALRSAVLAAFDEAQSRASRRRRMFPAILDQVDWRTIMTHPVSRWSAAAAMVVAIGAALWFVMDGSTKTALANFAEPLLNAKTAKLKMTSRVDGKVVGVSELLSSGTRMRIEMAGPDGSRRQITIMDEQNNVEFILLPTEKRAEIIHLKDRPERAKTGGFLAEIRKMLVESETDRKTTRDSLGEREVDGRRLVGYRISNPAMSLELWGDPATSLPYSITQTLSAYPSMTHTMSDFEFDMPFDESLLSQEPPEGYQVSERDVDTSLRTENDLIAALRTAADLNGGVFPDAVNMEIGHGLVKAFRQRNDGGLSADDLEKKCQELTHVVRGFLFTLQFPADRHHYAGKGVKVGTADKPIYWYQPDGKDTYRVIYADLSVADSNVKPAAK